MKRFIVAITVLVFAFASLSVAKPAKAKTSPKPARTAAKAVKKSEVKDARDGQVYRVVNIAGLTMAYGRLYSWDVAQKACPAGFRVPTHADFEKLWTAAGADFNAGYLLKTTYGWKGDTNGNDTLKFSAMPAGNRFDDGTYGNLAKFAFFWTADDKSEDIPAGEARVWYLTNKSMAFGYTAKSKKFAFSLRCVK